MMAENVGSDWCSEYRSVKRIQLACFVALTVVGTATATEARAARAKKTVENCIVGDKRGAWREASSEAGEADFTAVLLYF